MCGVCHHCIDTIVSFYTQALCDEPTSAQLAKFEWLMRNVRQWLTTMYYIHISLSFSLSFSLSLLSLSFLFLSLFSLSLFFSLICRHWWLG